MRVVHIGNQHMNPRTSNQAISRPDKTDTQTHPKSQDGAGPGLESSSSSAMHAGTHYGRHVRGPHHERERDRRDGDCHRAREAGGALHEQDQHVPRTSVPDSNMTKPALARGRLRCLGATNHDEHHRFFVSDAAFEALSCARSGAPRGKREERGLFPN